jgi:hypothetical protein
VPSTVPLALVAAFEAEVLAADALEDALLADALASLADVPAWFA